MALTSSSNSSRWLGAARRNQSAGPPSIRAYLTLRQCAPSCSDWRRLMPSPRLRSGRLGSGQSTNAPCPGVRPIGRWRSRPRHISQALPMCRATSVSCQAVFLRAPVVKKKLNALSAAILLLNSKIAGTRALTANTAPAKARSLQAESSEGLGWIGALAFVPSCQLVFEIHRQYLSLG